MGIGIYSYHRYNYYELAGTATQKELGMRMVRNDSEHRTCAFRLLVFIVLFSGTFYFVFGVCGGLQSPDGC